jgi:hypothetical protein
MKYLVGWDEEQHQIRQQEREWWSLGDDWGCRTVDTSVAVPEWSRDRRWKLRMQLGQNRCLDVRRCKGGEYHGESGLKC